MQRLKNQPLKKSLAFLIATIMALSILPWTIWVNAAGDYGDLTIESPELVVTGNQIITGSYSGTNVSGETSYTLNELKSMADEDVNAYSDNLYRYSTLNNSSTPGFYLAQGVQLNAILKESGITASAGTNVKAVASDNYAVTFDAGETRFYYPNFTSIQDDSGAETVPSILSWAYKEATGNGAVMPAAVSDTYSSVGLRLIAGQVSPTVANNSLFNRNLKTIIVGDALSEVVLTVGTKSYTRAQLLAMDRSERSYTYTTKSGDQTDYARGVPLAVLLEDYNNDDIVKLEMADGYTPISLTKKELVSGNYILAYEKGTSADDLAGIYESKSSSVYGLLTLFGDSVTPAKMVNKITVTVSSGIDFSNSDYKHLTNGGKGGSAPYNIDAITGATVTVEGPGVESSVPLSTREIENANNGLSRGVYKDSRGEFTYEGMDLYYLLNSMGSGSTNVKVTSSAYQVYLKDRNRRTVAVLTLEDVKKAHDAGSPILLAYGVGTKDGSKAAPFVYDSVNPLEKPLGYVDGLYNDDGCFKLVYDLDDYSSIISYNTFTNVAYVYVAEKDEPGYKHENSPYDNDKYSNYVVTFKGAGLGREISLTVKQLEDMVQYDTSGNIKAGGVGYRDEYSLSNNSYWYVNEYEGLDLHKLLESIGLKDTVTADTKVTFTATDGFTSSDSFTIAELANPNLFGYYEKNSADNNDGKYTGVPDDLLRTGYPVMLAYGINRYPYVINSGDEGYLNGLSNDGGPMRVIFGKREYSHPNGSNQIKLVKDIIVGADDLLYNTHKYTDNTDHNSLTNNGLSIVVNNIKGAEIINKPMTVGEIEDLIYGPGVSSSQKKDALVKSVFDVKGYADIYEGVSLDYLLTNFVGIPGLVGTVTFSNGTQDLTVDIDELFYKDSSGNVRPVLTFAKNGAPMVESKSSDGYVSTYDFLDGYSYSVKNSGGPLSVLIPGASETLSLSNVTSITVNLEEDKYAHINDPYDKFAGDTILFTGDGLSKETTYSVADIEGKQKLAITKDYSLRNSSGVVNEQRYRGVSLYELLREVGLRSNAYEVIVYSSDGTSKTFSLADIRKSDYINSNNASITGLTPILAYGSSSAANADIKDGLPLVKTSADTGYDAGYKNDGGPLRFIIPQKDSQDVNNGNCVKTVTKIEVTASELDSWKHSVNDIYSQFLNHTFEFTVKNDTHEWKKTYTLAELEDMDDVILRQDYTVLNMGACEGLDIWSFIMREAGLIEGIASPNSVSAYASDGFFKELLGIFGMDALKNGIIDSNGDRKEILMSYAIQGYPFVDSTSHEGYVGAAANSSGPLRLITETNQGASLKELTKLVVVIPGSGEIINPADEPEKPQEYMFTTYYNTGEQGDLGLGSIRDVQIDKDGGMWVATYGSGAFYRPAGSDVFTISTLDTEGYKLQSSVIQSIAIDGDGGVWFTQAGSYTDPDSSKGVAYLAPDGTITYYNPSTPNTIPSYYVQEVEIDENGNVWFGSAAGLTRYNPSTGEWKTWTDQDGLPALSVCVIAPTQNGVWIGLYPDAQSPTGPFSGGYAYLDASTDEIIFKYIFGTDEDDPCNDTSLLADFWVRDIAVDANGGAWIVRSGSYSYLENVGGRVDYAAPDGTITHYTGKDLLGESNLPNNSEIRTVLVDPDGGLWFGTWTGVFYCEQPGTVTAVYNSQTDHDGLQTWAANKHLDNVFSMAFFGDVLYVGSDGGVSFYKFEFENDPVTPKDPTLTDPPINPEEPKQPENPKNPENPGNPKNPGKDGKDPGKDKNSSNVRTGDNIPIMLLASIAIVSLAILAVLENRRKNKEMIT